MSITNCNCMKINTAQIVSDCSFVQYFSMCSPFSAITNRIRDRNPSMALLITRGGVEDTRLEAKAKDSLSEDRHSRGQGQECSRPRPRTQAQVLSKKKKSSQNFSSDLHKKTFSKKFFKRFTKFSIQKIVLSSSRGQANF